MSRRLLFTPCILFCFVATSFAVDHRVEILSEPPPSDAAAAEIMDKIGATGFKIIRGSSRTVCEIWPCKQWEVGADFKPTNELLYPFQQGQLIGLLRFPRRGSDFRDQQINSGVYTLRYALQPVDGNHVGTSPTRDFLLLVRADEDTSPENMDVEQLSTLSAAAAESNHPAMLCLQRPEGPAAENPSIRHNEENDWWLVHFSATALANGKKYNLPVDLIVAGNANE